MDAAPVSARWTQESDPGQAGLEGFLDDVATRAAARMAVAPGGTPLTLELRIGLRPGTPLTEHCDLDNYLLPVVHRLGPARFDAVFGTKLPDNHSTLGVAPSRPCPAQRDPDLQVTLESAKARPQRSIRLACTQAQRLDPQGAGPIKLTISYVLGPSRSWTALWKASITGLDPLLGTTWTHVRHRHPREGRITDLALHRTIDPQAGDQVRIDMWWEILPPAAWRTP